MTQKILKMFFAVSSDRLLTQVFSVYHSESISACLDSCYLAFKSQSGRNQFFYLHQPLFTRVCYVLLCHGCILCLCV